MKSILRMIRLASLLFLLFCSAQTVKAATTYDISIDNGYCVDIYGNYRYRAEPGEKLYVCARPKSGYRFKEWNNLNNYYTFDPSSGTVDFSFFGYDSSSYTTSQLIDIAMNSYWHYEASLPIVMPEKKLQLSAVYTSDTSHINSVNIYIRHYYAGSSPGSVTYICNSSDYKIESAEWFKLGSDGNKTAIGSSLKSANGMSRQTITATLGTAQKRRTYTITYVNPLGQTTTQTVAADDSLPLPTYSSSSYYTFKGWTTSVSSTSVVADDTLVKSDITLYAYWEDKQNRRIIPYPTVRSGSSVSKGATVFSVYTAIKDDSLYSITPSVVNTAGSHYINLRIMDSYMIFPDGSQEKNVMIQVEPCVLEEPKLLKNTFEYQSNPGIYEVSFDTFESSYYSLEGTCSAVTVGTYTAMINIQNPLYSFSNGKTSLSYSWSITPKILTTPRAQTSIIPFVPGGINVPYYISDYDSTRMTIMNGYTIYSPGSHTVLISLNDSHNTQFSNGKSSVSVDLNVVCSHYESGPESDRIYHDATCENEAYYIYQCAYCNENVSQTLSEALGHDPGTPSITKATLTTDGKTETYCNRCKKLVDQRVISRPKTFTLSAKSYVYDGKVKTPVLTIKDASGKVIPSTSYQLTKASGRKYVGQYTYKITFQGSYSGKKTLFFTILPKSTSLSSLTAVSKGFKAVWSKQRKQVTGYELQYSTSAKFTDPKTVTIKSNVTTSKSVSKLTARKKYYVRVRTYKTVGKARYYSKWSKSKYVVTNR